MFSIWKFHPITYYCKWHSAIFTSKNSYQPANHRFKWPPPYSRGRYTAKCKFPGNVGNHGFFRLPVSASRGDSEDSLTDALLEGDGEGLSTGNGDTVEFSHDDSSATRFALAEAKTRQQEAENERDRLTEELIFSEAKQQEYAASLRHTQEVTVSELEAAKSMFNQKLQESLDEKFALESKLVLAKQDAVELALQVEKLAEIAFQQATSHILADAQQRVSAAETYAAEAAYHIEEQIRSAAEGSILSIVKQSEDTFNKVISVTEEASQQAKNAMAVLSDEVRAIDEITSQLSSEWKSENTIRDLQSQLLIRQNEVEKLKSELENVQEKARAAEVRASNAERALIDLQEDTNRMSSQMHEEMKAMLDKVKREAAGREKAVAKAFKLEMESIKSAVDAAKMAVQVKDEAYLRRCAALERSLRTSEVALNAWRQRAETSESMFQEGGALDRSEEMAFMASGGRIDLLVDGSSEKWKLLADGPRREIPDYMSRRIWSLLPRFPPRKVPSEVLATDYPVLSLPKPDEVWSIVQEKPKQDDVLIKHVAEKEAIEKQRKALERALRRRTIKRRISEETKLEPGTGTGREIVFQGFNWESWRREWYKELAAKATDLSQSGITAVWFPPPTESVAPQGYMPSDLYNLNSAYGTVEDLQHSIEEMHAHDLMALGDVVLNHRCAQKQSPNGVWNIFGGNLAWGPEAIVCDDPNFQGRGNPSSGDIFHAAPNIDHSQEFVRKDIKVWLNWLRNDIGFDGWRLDFVRGFSGHYVKEYIEASNPVFAIGEYWDSLSYEGGNLCYNQDGHRQRIVNWINATAGTSSAFDVTTKGILHSAVHNQYWRLIDPQGKPTGVMGWWPSRAVTFLENHDTGSTQGHWPFPRDKLTQGYAYILTHPGTPTIFYDHFYDFGLRETITELIEARRRAGIHCRSSVKIFHANNDGYVAHVGDNLVMKLGHFDWNPSKENQLEGSWQNFVDRGSDYQIWLRQ